jgi:hypothetical protein
MTDIIFFTEIEITRIQSQVLCPSLQDEVREKIFIRGNSLAFVLCYSLTDESDKILILFLPKDLSHFFVIKRLRNFFWNSRKSQSFKNDKPKDVFFASLLCQESVEWIFSDLGDYHWFLVPWIELYSCAFKPIRDTKATHLQSHETFLPSFSTKGHLQDNFSRRYDRHEENQQSKIFAQER